MISVNSIPFDSIRFDYIKEGFERTVPAVVIVVVLSYCYCYCYICYQLFRLLLRRRLQRQAIDEGNKIHHLLFLHPLLVPLSLFV